MTSLTAPDLLLLALAAAWGAATGTLLPRAAYRFSVPLDDPQDPPTEVPATEDPATGDPATEDTPSEAPAPAHRTTDEAPAGEAPTDEAPAGEAPTDEPPAPLPPWRHTCPSGHPFPTPTGPRSWTGPARCPSCPATEPPYGPRAWPLATVTALLCGLAASATGVRPELAVWLLLTPVGVLLAAVDLRVKRLPDPLTLPLAATALALLGVAALLPEHAGHWTTALLGTLALGTGYLVLHLISPGGMGFGDVKLALGAGAVLGWYGWPTLMLGTLAGFVLGALYGVALLATGRADRRTAIPYGPFLIAGAYLGVLVGAYTA
ncbi:MULTISPECIES: prepilin peptidase [unclassified Streptomyces]|uniref:prepilin peptidase n=1 Tax=unclassified Streptomyces TaxID=2593676 RepID=UPI0038048C8D